MYETTPEQRFVNLAHANLLTLFFLYQEQVSAREIERQQFRLLRRHGHEDYVSKVCPQRHQVIKKKRIKPKMTKVTGRM
jgi:hypothetical protein